MKSSAVLSVALLLPACFNPDGPDPGEDPQAGTTTEGDPTDPDDPADTDPLPDDDDDSDSAEETTDTMPVEPDVGDAPPLDCDSDAACTVDAPFCVDDVCVTCLDAPEGACAEAFPSSPVCGDGSCIGCTEHEQCGSGACDIFTGACFEEDNVLHVDNQAACGGSGDEASPMCSLGDALDAIDAQPSGTAWMIRLAGGATPYAEAIRSREDHPIAILGDDTGLSPIIAAPSGATLHVNQGRAYLANLRLEGSGPQTVYSFGGNAYLHDVTVANASADTGILMAGGELEAHRVVVGTDYLTGVEVQAGAMMRMYDSTISSNLGGAIVAGDLELHRCEVAQNYVEGGIQLTGSLTLVNSFVYGNGYARGGLDASGPATAIITYSTITDGFDCPEAISADVRNSIVIGGFGCENATVTNSAVDSGAVDQGPDNVELDMSDTDFLFVDFAGGDLHIADVTWLAGVAQWRSGDPQTDIDGDARPMQDGAEDMPGADVPN